MTVAKNDEGSVLSERFPNELAFWHAHQGELINRYPGKFLIIRGEAVSRVLNTLEDLIVAEQEELNADPGLVCSTHSVEPVINPYIEASE